MVYPDSFQDKTGFARIRAELVSLCFGPLGADRAEEMTFTSDSLLLDQWHGQTAEMVAILTGDGTFPSQGYIDVRPALRRIAIEGAGLTVEEAFDLLKALRAVSALTRFFSAAGPGRYPYLNRIAESLVPFPETERALDRVFDAYGQVKDSASPALAELRQTRSRLMTGITRLLGGILRQAQAEGYVERGVSPALREGRLVIPVTPAYKHKVHGIVHDESASGKTVFIEPAEVVENNNRIRGLEAEEAREIARILMEITVSVRPSLPDLMEACERLGDFDFVHAKALYAIQTRSVMPRATDASLMDWKRARHPLLEESLRQQGRDMQPLDIRLSDEARILIISGPNAGGKSVCLKTAGLLQYMWQCGLLVPVSEDSVVGLFENLFLDIGDEQSIDNDLSTYSSHLRNMKFFLKNASARTLLLIDEFGSGTEPLMGGAIAEAELDRFREAGCYGVITTHYTNLKHYASSHEGVVNGAMLYDRHLMQPLFQLAVGHPGSSFAIDIARQTGLPEEVIRRSAELVGEERIQYDKYLQDIVRDKRYWERKREQIHLREKKMAERDAQLQERLDGIEKERKAILREAKEETKRLLREANAQIERTIRDIRQAQADKERTSEARARLKSFDERATAPEPEKGKEKVSPRAETRQGGADNVLRPGDSVLSDGNVGELLEIKGRKAVVAFGALRATVPLDSLSRANRKERRRQERVSLSVGKETLDAIRERKLNFKPRLDLRGMRAEEARQALELFMDDARMVGVSPVSVLHGTGTGALRDMTRQYLRTLGWVKSFHDEHVQLGGAGITVVEWDD